MRLQGISDKGFRRLAQDTGVDEREIQDFTNSLSDFGIAGQQPSSYEISEFLGAGDNPNEWASIDGPDIGMPGATSLELSNHETLWKILYEHMEDIEHYPTNQKLIHVFNSDGSFTGAGQALEEIMQSLANYPVLDEDDYLEREHEEAISNIEWEGRSLVDYDAPDDWAEQVFRWLWENDQNALESNYPSEDEIRPALEALGWLEEEE